MLTKRCPWFEVDTGLYTFPPRHTEIMSLKLGALDSWLLRHDG
jgi:hypothetical protein